MSKYFDYEVGEDMEYMMVPRALANKLEEATDRKSQEAIFFKAVEEKKIDIRREIEALDDDLLLFKAFGTKYKNELDKIYNEQYSKIEETWSKLSAGDSIYRKLNSLNDCVKGITNTLDDVDSKIKYLSVSKLESALELIDRFNRMSDGDKSIMKTLMEVDK